MKKQRLALSDAAVTDILEQAEWYQHQSGYRLAKRWDDAVTFTLLRILQNPQSGPCCSFKSEELQDIRRIPVAGFRKHLVFYRFYEQELLIVRIVHGARDLESLF